MRKGKAQLEELEEVARGGTDNKSEVREKTIRVRVKTYERLRKRGSMGDDFDDVITRLLDETEK
jgi:hypothetical protein